MSEAEKQGVGANSATPQPSSSSSSGRVSGSSSAAATAPNARGQTTRARITQRKRTENPHRNVQIAQKDQAIWEFVKMKTQEGSKIYIGKNTVVQPGATIIAEKGTIIIGENNIISEGVSIVNKSSDDMVIGNGNLFECNCRIEAAKIGDYNVFGPKCHVMQDSVIGIGCVICPRVMVIQKKRIRDAIVVFGDNMMHEQPLMKKRNRAYIEQMVPVLKSSWMSTKAQSQQGGAGARARSMRSSAGRGRGSSRQSGATATAAAVSSSGARGGAAAPTDPRYANKSRAETPLKQ